MHRGAPASCHPGTGSARLAACVHLRPHTAIYRWQNRVEEAAEYALLAKTTEARFAALRDAILAPHKYDLPANLAMPVSVDTRRSSTGLPRRRPCPACDHKCAACRVLLALRDNEA